MLAFAADPVKIFLTPSSIIMQNLVAVPHTMCADVGQTLKHFGDAGVLLPWDGVG